MCMGLKFERGTELKPYMSNDEGRELGAGPGGYSFLRA